ncbi:MAG: phage portal protein, partial [Candidatus Nanoarchaeia archaeon]|nr:phage portal protein [Candidatus Nanoarchaeia archaeon]
YQNNECLVVEHNGQLLVADSFDHKEYALIDDVFTNVAVGDFTFTRSFFQSEVLYFKLQHCNMRALVNGLYQTYSKLISYSMTAYQRSRGTKGILKYDTLPPVGTAQRETFDALINEKIGKWLTGDNAALPLGTGQEWKDLDHKTYSDESTRDIRAQIDDISDFTAKGFGIHPALMRGDIQDIEAAFMYTMTFGVDPLVDNLQAEINRKRNGYAGMSRGTYLKIDTKQIKHVDLLSMASPIDKLIGSGTFNVNDIRKLLGEDIINEPWAFQHFITKNYVTFNEAMNGTKKGGEE